MSNTPDEKAEAHCDMCNHFPADHAKNGLRPCTACDCPALIGNYENYKRYREWRDTQPRPDILIDDGRGIIEPKKLRSADGPLPPQPIETDSVEAIVDQIIDEYERLGYTAAKANGLPKLAQREAAARREELEDIETVWASEWDCSRTPGHPGMNEYLTARLKALKGEKQ